MAQIASSIGGRSIAVCSAENPPQLMPHIPIRPVHHGWSTSHSITATLSSCSMGRYSPMATPSEAPVPRMSTRAPAIPRSARYVKVCQSRL